MDIITNLLAVVLLVIWIALIYWTYADARRRIEDRFLVTCATVGALFPFIGSLVYLIVRPPEFLEDVRERNLEIAASEAVIHGSAGGGGVCPHCDAPTDKDFVRCPACLRKLRESCASCSRPVEPEWRICPYCEADPRQAGGAKSARRARPEGTAKAPAAARKPSNASARKSGNRAKSQSTGEQSAVKSSASERSAARDRQAVKTSETPVEQTPRTDTPVGESEHKD